jgi:hypothetical protein
MNDRYNAPDKPTEYMVVGLATIGDAAPGETVRLDPDEVNISALLEAGAIEPVKSKTTASTTRAGSDSDTKK